MMPIGRGGMGEVWRGVHAKAGVPIAAKVISQQHIEDELFLAAFRTEVRAVARLNHPGIVMVLDHGEIDQRAADASGGRLIVASPYVVMTWLDGGTLAHCPPTDWRSLKESLLILLDALAYAHARNVIHRDLKPRNVLFRVAGDRRTLTLIDFGLATLGTLGDGHRKRIRAGTRGYAAPEQVLVGRFRDQGPWTDLFSLGCLAYALAAGHPPYRGESTEEVLQNQLLKRPPRLTSVFPVPQGFQGWLNRLLQWDPFLRYRCAADAASGLIGLEHVSDSAPSRHFGSAVETTIDTVADYSRAPTGTSVSQSNPALQANAMPVLSALTTLTARGAEIELDQQRMGDVLSELAPIVNRPIPNSWVCDYSPRPSMALVGAGLSLYGLRTVPLVGRDQERDLIWDRITAVDKNQRAQLVLLQGPAGVGKSRLVEWMTQRAHELGAAFHLKAVHSPNDGHHDALSRMVAEALNCVGLPRPEMVERIGALLREQNITDDYERDALVEVIAPLAVHGEPVSGRKVHFTSTTERYTAIERFLGLWTQHRPLIVWMDDVQWGSDTLGFAAHLLDAQEHSPSPILLLLTAQQEALAERPLESLQLEECLTFEQAQRLDVRPLNQNEHSALVQKLLALEGDLADRVIDRTRGNPLFAVQLIGDWVRRGVLEVGTTGFVLKVGEEAVLPDDLFNVWGRRIGRLVDEIGGKFPRDQLETALEVAGVLGQTVELEQWQAACSHLNLAVPPQLREALISTRLVDPTETGCVFVHGMLREALERRARQKGRLKALHHACSQTLWPRYQKGEQGVAERLAYHLLHAGDPQAALEPLLQAAETRRQQRDFHAVGGLLDQLEVVFAETGIETTDPRMIDAWCLWASVHTMHTQNFDRALEYVDRAINASRKRDVPSKKLATALHRKGDILYLIGEQEQAKRLLNEAREIYRCLGDDLGLGLTNCSAAGIYSRLGQNDQAWESYQRAIRHFEAVDNRHRQAACFAGLATIASRQGKDSTAIELFETASRMFEELGDSVGVAGVSNNLADLERQRGNLEAAAAHYRKAMKHPQRSDPNRVYITRFNLSLLLLARERYEEARNDFNVLLKDMQRLGGNWVVGAIHIGLLCCVAALRDWSAYEHHYSEADSMLTATGITDVDFAEVFQKTGDLALADGKHQQARKAYEWAHKQWLAMGRQDRLAQVEASLELCGC